MALVVVWLKIVYISPGYEKRSCKIEQLLHILPLEEDHDSKIIVLYGKANNQSVLAIIILFSNMKIPRSLQKDLVMLEY